MVMIMDQHVFVNHFVLGNILIGGRLFWLFGFLRVAEHILYTYVMYITYILYVCIQLYTYLAGYPQ